MLKYFTIIVLFFLFISCYSSDFEERLNKGKVEYDQLDEISGLVFGRTNKDIIWAVNDGRADEIYGIDRNGKSLTYLNFSKDILPIDTDIEDIATIRYNGANYIVLADIGDNNSSRENINLFFIPEIKYSGSAEIKIDDNLILQFSIKYEDGSRDAECLFVDPNSNKIYIVTKRESRARLYEISSDFNVNNVNTAKFVSDFDFGNNISSGSTGVTAGDISSDGQHILIRDYTSVWYFENTSLNLKESLKAKPKVVESYNYSINEEPQGESIAWDSDISGFYTVSEEKSFDNFEADLFFFKRKLSSVKKKNELIFINGDIFNNTSKSIYLKFYNILGQMTYSSALQPNESLNIKVLNIKAQYLLYDNKFYKITID
ncbi:MAG: hypothetical protein ACE364_01630 [Chlorobiota bacterium]